MITITNKQNRVKSYVNIYNIINLLKNANTKKNKILLVGPHMTSLTRTSNYSVDIFSSHLPVLCDIKPNSKIIDISNDDVYITSSQEKIDNLIKQLTFLLIQLNPMYICCNTMSVRKEGLELLKIGDSVLSTYLAKKKARIIKSVTHDGFEEESLKIRSITDELINYLNDNLSNSVFKVLSSIFNNNSLLALEMPDNVVNNLNTTIYEISYKFTIFIMIYYSIDEIINHSDKENSFIFANAYNFGKMKDHLMKYVSLTIEL